MTKTSLHKGIAYTKVGSGTHLCFLHGFCEQREVWDPIIDQLKHNHTCIAIDLPGFGESIGHRFKSMKYAAYCIREVLEHEGISKVTVFGHSMGGYVMAQLLADAPELFTGVGFIHSTSRADSEEKRNNRQKTIEFLQKNGTDDFFPLFAQGLVAKSNYMRLENALFSMIRKTSMESIIDASNAMMTREDLLHIVEGQQVPTLFLHGSADGHLNYEAILYQASRCTPSQIDILHGTGHLSMLEDSEACLGTIANFIQFIDQI